MSFVFDQNSDPTWNRAVAYAHALAKKNDSRIAGLTFADKKIMPHLPLQAADMLAYRFNQIARKFVDPNVSPAAKEADMLMMKPMIKSFKIDPYRGLMDFFSAAPLRFSRYPWRRQSK